MAKKIFFILLATVLLGVNGNPQRIQSRSYQSNQENSISGVIKSLGIDIKRIPDLSQESFINSFGKNKPENIDWRQHGAVTPAVAQGTCGASYAFSAAGAIESHLFIKTNKLQQLSPQNILDCTLGKPYENNGCEYGNAIASFDYVKDKGIASESSYPYEGKAGTECKFKPEISVTSIKDYVLLDEGDDNQLEKVLATKGPVASGIDGNSQQFTAYSEGIYYNPSCNSSVDALNLGILIVGYGIESDGQKFWLIKNFYGPQWGENGFAKIARNVTNHCGISTYAAYPIV